MSTTATPEGPGSVSGAPKLPRGSPTRSRAGTSTQVKQPGVSLDYQLRSQISAASLFASRQSLSDARRRWLATMPLGGRRQLRGSTPLHCRSCHLPHNDKEN
jgi:hypothetical protein